MEMKIPAGTQKLLAETTALTRLTIGQDAELTTPEGKLLTLTVDGVHRDIAPGTYSGNVVLSVTDTIDFGYENHGQMEWFHMNAAVSIHDGKYIAGESVAAAQIQGDVGDGAAKGLNIRSEGDYFGGVYVDGKGRYVIDGADIVMNGHGGSDAVGYGASIAVRGDAEVTINHAKIHNAGSIRTALQVCGHGKVTVNDSEFSAEDIDRPNYVKAMSKAPWMLGIHGRVRTTNIQDYGEVTYNRCKVSAQNWGAMSTDGTKHVRLSMYDSEVTVTGSGYGAYSIGECHDYFSGCKITVPDYGVIQCGGESMVTYTAGTVVEAGRSAVMMHGGGKPGLLRVDGGSKLHSCGPMFQIKGRGADILVEDATLSSDQNILLEIIENDDPNGRGMHMGPETVMDVPPGGFPGGGPGDPVKEEIESGGPGGPGGPGPDGPGPDVAHRAELEEVFPVTARFTKGSYSGDIFHAYSERNDAIIHISNADYTGRITTSVSSHPAGLPRSKEQYPLIGRVEHFPCPRDTDFGVKVILEGDASWTVTAASYLTKLTIGEGCTVRGTLTVNGEPIPLTPGTYTGKLVLNPAQ